MAGNVKGLVVEIGADISKFDGAIKKIDSSLRSTRNELSQVNRALKFSPGNATLLKQKQDLLSKSIAETKTKLTNLKNEYATMAQQPGFDKNSEDARRLQREIIETESKLSNLEGKLAQVASVTGAQFEAAGAKIKAVGDKISAAGSTMTKNITGPIAAVAGVSVKAFSEVDDGLDIIAQKTGAAGEALSAMEDSAKELAGEIPTDFETAGAAIGEVNTRFGLTGDALKDLSGDFIKFAKLNNVDVSTSIDQTQKALAAFGLEAKDAGPLLDTLNTVGQNTGASMDVLLGGLVQNAAAFQELGLSAEQSATLMGQMETSGANSETVMQGLRKALKNAAKEGIPLDQALSDLQTTIKDGKGGVDGLTAAYDLFGKSGDQIYAAVKNGTLDFANLGVAAADSADSVSSTFENTLDPIDKAKMAFNQAKVAGAELGATVLSQLAPGIQKLSGFITTLTAKWQELSPAQQGMIVKIAGIVAAIGPALLIIGKLTSGIGSVVAIAGKAMNLISAASMGIGPLGAVISAIASPIGIVVAAIGALVAAFVVLYNKNEEFRAAVQPVWDQIKEVISAAVELIKTIISTFIETVKAWWDEWGDTIINSVITVWNAISPIISAALDAIKAIISTVMALIKGDWEGAWEGIKAYFSAIWDGIKAIVNAAINAVKAVITAVWDAVKSKTQAIWSGIKGVISSIWSGIKSGVTSAINAVKDKVSSVWNSIKSTTKSVWDAIKNAITKPIDAAKDKVKSILDKVKSFFPLKIGKIFSDLKLPHIHVEGGKAPFGIAGKGSLPHFSVDWHRDAYDNPLLFVSPTVIPSLYGAQGFGDKSGGGGELVYGHDNLMRDIKNAVSSEKQPTQTIINITMTVNGADNPQQIADELSREIQRRVRMA